MYETVASLDGFGKLLGGCYLPGGGSGTQLGAWFRWRNDIPNPPNAVAPSAVHLIFGLPQGGGGGATTVFGGQTTDLGMNVIQPGVPSLWTITANRVSTQVPFTSSTSSGYTPAEFAEIKVGMWLDVRSDEPTKCRMRAWTSVYE